jgi:hypothetical protein
LDVYAKLWSQSKSTLLAICDKDVLGKILKDGPITFHIREEFYRGTLVSLPEAIEMIEQSNIINMVGSKIVNEALTRGFVHPEAILKIEGIPHAQIVKF